VPECQKLKTVGYGCMAKCNNLRGWTLKSLTARVNRPIQGNVRWLLLSQLMVNLVQPGWCRARVSKSESLCSLSVWCAIITQRFRIRFFCFFFCFTKASLFVLILVILCFVYNCYCLVDSTSAIDCLERLVSKNDLLCVVWDSCSHPRPVSDISHGVLHTLVLKLFCECLCLHSHLSLK